MWCPLYSLFLRFTGVGSLGSDVDVAWFCGPSPLCPFLWDLVSDVRRFEMVATVLGSPWVGLLILCSPLGCGFGFGMGLIVPHGAGGWGWPRSAVESLSLFLALLPVPVLALVTTLYTWHCGV